MTLVPGWMWQTMHWLVGMELPVRTGARSDGPVRPWEWSGRDRLRQLTGHAAVAVLGIGPRMDRRAIVGIDHVAGGAAAGAIIAGLVVGAEEVQRRIEQARFLQADEDGIGAVLGAEAAIAKRVRNGRPGSSFVSGMPVSGRKRPPRSKMRRMLPG